MQLIAKPTLNKAFILIFFFFLGSSFQQTSAGSFSVSGTTLNLDLDVANQILTVVSTGTSYTFTLSGGATNTWTGTTSASVTVSGAVLTVTATGLSTFSNFNITDSQTGNGVTFASSGTNAYSDNFDITLDNSPGGVTFNGSSSFTGANTLSITTSNRISFLSLSSLSTADGNLTLQANMQAVPSSMNFSGIRIDSATVQVTGTGILTMSARGGTGSASSYQNCGIAVINGGLVKGGTTGTTTVTGYGYTGFAGTQGNINACGILLAGKSSTAPPTITSNGSNVLVTGYGANSTAVNPTGFVIQHVGVSVGNVSSIPTDAYGLITSGNTGTVTVNGFGGTCAAFTTSGGKTYCHGVGVGSRDNTPNNGGIITSGGSGKVTVTGTGGGPDTVSNGNCGVHVKGLITSGTNADLEVVGYQGKSRYLDATNQTEANGGVTLYNGIIQAGPGTGTTRVVGTGASSTAGTINSIGVHFNNGGKISALGSGSVTVIGTSTNASPSGGNFGVYLRSNNDLNPNANNLSTITSNGGDVVVQGTGGGKNNANNHGVNLPSGCSISAGGNGNVNVTGYGGNNNGTSGNTNYGVVVIGTRTAYSTTVPMFDPYISSSGGNVTVKGVGGGGNSSSLAASSSSSNYGVYCYQSSIYAGGSGTVRVDGTGGNTSPGATGGINYGVYIDEPVLRTAAPSYIIPTITSSGGNVIVNGTGGGGSGSGSANNHGVFNKGLIKSKGQGTLSVTGTGGAGGGSSNMGVRVQGGSYFGPYFSAPLTSDSASVTVNGNGGGSGSSSLNNGILVTLGGMISAGANGNVSVTGTGGNGLDYNMGVNMGGGSGSIYSSITSGGGNVMVTGNGNGTGVDNHGVQLINGGIISAGGTGTVSVFGNGGTSSGTSNLGINVAGGTSPNFSTITSGGGNINLIGTEGGSSGSLAVKVITSGRITTATNGGDITIKGNSFNSDGSPVSANSSGSVNFIPLTNGTEVKFESGTDSKGTLSFSSTEMDGITGGNINFGNTNTGLITVSQAVAPAVGSNLKLTTGSAISPLVNGTEITMAAGKTLDLTGVPAVNIAINGTTVNTDYDQLKVVANLTLTGKTLNLSGTYVPAGCDVFTIVEATAITGTFSGLANGATLTFNGKLLVINYTSTQVILSNSAPNATSQPASQTVNTGDAASFTASSCGTPSPTVQWQVSSNGGTTWSNLSGQTAATLSFTASATQNNNQYRAVFTNIGGTATSSVATLTVISLCTPTYSAETIVSCNSFTWHGTTYTSSNTATWTGTNADGCDSVVTLNLTINSPTSSTETSSACGSYLWHGTTYTTSGAKTWTGSNAAGCDSVVTLNLTITPQPVQPTIACYQTATFNNSTCSWDVTGTQPVQPLLACYQSATFNTTTCSWDVTGTQPVQPTIACYQTATFNNSTCSWDVTGTQPAQPTLACYQTATFNTTTCSWDVTGTQPAQPTLACYQTATFNTITCSWDVTGTQPVQPTLACYQSATFNTSTCSWDVTGTQPVQPTLACYQTATFNTITCSWNVTGTQPVQPTLACYQTATFNTTTCSWDVTGTQPAQPTLACYQTATFNNTTCSWDVTGTQPNAIVTTTSACNTYTWSANNAVYTQTGTYSYNANCQFYTLNLTIKQPTTSTTTATAYGSYNWNGNSYNNSGTYTYHTLNAAGCDSTATLSLTVNPIVINNVGNVCTYIGTNETLVYTASVAGASSYTWTLPPNTQVVSGQGSRSIVIKLLNGFSNQSNKQIRVLPAGGSLQIFYLLSQTPVTPSCIVPSSTNICQSIGTNVPITFTIPRVYEVASNGVTATSYLWTAQNGTTVITHPNGTGVNDTTVAITFSSNFSSSNISVQAVNACGVSNSRTYQITLGAPSQPGLISGPTNACEYLGESGLAATYSVPADLNVVSYSWNLPQGASNVTGQGTRTISFKYPSGFTSGNVSVTATNGCGTSQSRSLYVSRLTPVTPGNIDVINVSTCPSRVYTYSVATLPANATSLLWSVPSGATLLSGQGSISINVSYPSSVIDGNVTVKAVSNCGLSSERKSVVKLAPCPTNPSPQYTKVLINAIPSAMEVKVFPNPTTSFFNMNVITPAAENVKARLLDVQGRWIKTIMVNPNETITLGSDLKPGVYMLDIKQGNEVKIMRLVKY